jgi:quercetin 2,3-dioxygenase
MKTIIHKSDSRGKADHGWLKSNHSFSFASYHNPERMGFGLLRVLNDDVVEPSRGFGTHPHENMEIVSIPLSGSLRHKDSEGNKTVIKSGEVQIMSAGTGVLHSEFNDSGQDPVNFLQIWVMPEKLNIAPRYDQREFPESGRQNQFQVVVSPLDTSDQGIKINQQAYFSLASLGAGNSLTYHIHNLNHGAYVFVFEGSVDVFGETLQTRDAIGIQDASAIELIAASDTNLLVIEVPMNQ